MKNQYVCEKCGKTFTDYDEAWNCEYSHCDVDVLYPWELPQNSNLPLTVYEEGCPYPEYIVLKGEVKDKDGNRLTKTMPNGNIHYVHEALCYKLVIPPMHFPLMPDYTDGLLARAVADNRKEDEEG